MAHSASPQDYIDSDVSFPFFDRGKGVKGSRMAQEVRAL